MRQFPSFKVLYVYVQGCPYRTRTGEKGIKFLVLLNLLLIIADFLDYCGINEQEKTPCAQALSDKACRRRARSRFRDH